MPRGVGRATSQLSRSARMTRRRSTWRRTRLARCYEQLVDQGIDPAQYNYVEAASDVLDLMAALHIARRTSRRTRRTTSSCSASCGRHPPRCAASPSTTRPPRGSRLRPIPSAISRARSVGSTRRATPIRCAHGDYPDLAGVWRTSQQSAAANPPPVVNAPEPRTTRVLRRFPYCSTRGAMRMRWGPRWTTRTRTR